MNFFKSAYIYVVATFIDKGIGFILTPFYSHYLSTADAGMLYYFSTIYTFLFPLFTLQTDTALKVCYAKEPDNFVPYSRAAISNVFISCFLFTLLFILFRQPLSNTLGLPTGWIISLPILASITGFSICLVALYEITRRTASYVAIILSVSISTLILTIFFIRGLGMNYEGRMYAIFIPGVTIGLLCAYLMYKNNLLRFGIDIPMQRRMFKQSIGLVFDALSFVVMNMADRVIVKEVVGAGDLGIYSTAYSIAGLVFVFSHALSIAWNPFIFGKLGSTDKRDKYVLVLASYGFMSIVVLSVIGLALITPFIYTYLIGSNFQNGSQYVLWIAIGYGFIGFYRTVMPYFVYYKESKTLTILALINIVFIIICYYVLVSIFGTIGAAYGTAIVYAVYFLELFTIAYYKFPMPWFEFKRLWVVARQLYRSYRSPKPVTPNM
jgi:O-antigen/teichoic acid export membrane protein